MRPRQQPTDVTSKLDCVFVAFCCACANGYDGSLMGSITFMKQFQNQMGSQAVGWKVSVMTSLYSVLVLVYSLISFLHFPFSNNSQRFDCRDALCCFG